MSAALAGEFVDARLKTLEAHLQTLWLQAIAGNGACYAQVLHELSGLLRKFVQRRLHTSSQDTEDVVQDILLAIHQKRHTYQSDYPLTAWVYAIARYKVVDHLRARQRRADTQDLSDDESAPSLWSQDTHDIEDLLAHMLSSLSDKQRLTIEHTKLAGHSIAETAQLTGQSEAAVKANVHRGLKALMKKFGMHT